MDERKLCSLLWERVAFGYVKIREHYSEKSKVVWSVNENLMEIGPTMNDHNLLLLRHECNTMYTTEQKVRMIKTLEQREMEKKKRKKECVYGDQSSRMVFY